jgi:2-polyprenyl-6-methoxyphenol hydroxylase-like FAD-dependent oxidoreductase
MSTPHINKTQVVIVGAGPTGLTMAVQLIRHNIDFILIEKKEKITHLSKAIAVQARSLEIFEELGIAEEAIKRGRVTTGLRLFYKGKQKLKVDLSGLGNGLSHFSFALSLEQSKTEQLLIDYLNAHRKQVQWRSEFLHFEQQDDGVTVYYKDEQGVEQKIETGYLVGCDGAGSLIRHQLDLGFKGSTEPKLFYVADVLLNSPVINDNTLYMHMIKKGFILFFPMEGIGHYRIVGIIPGKADDNTEYKFSDIELSIKQQIVSPVDFTELRWFSTYRVHSRKADSFIKGRCFIAGDAGHIHTPAGGQGMNTGIQDAYNLAWKIAYRIRGEVNDDVINSYDTERTANAKRLLKTTDRIFDLMSGANRFWNLLRNSFFPILISLMSRNKWVQLRIFPLLSQTGITYPDSYLSLKSSIGKVKAGDRMHYFVFSDGRNIFSYLTEPVFKLIWFGKWEVEIKSKIKVKIAISYLSFNEIPASIFGNASEFYVLLRPDNHVSYIGKSMDSCRELINKISH